MVTFPDLIFVMYLNYEKVTSKGYIMKLIKGRVNKLYFRISISPKMTIIHIFFCNELQNQAPPLPPLLLLLLLLRLDQKYL